MITSILQEMNSPTLGSDTPAKGKKIYDVVHTNEMKVLNIVIDLTLVGTAITEVNYKVLGDHVMEHSDIMFQIFGIVYREDNSLTWEL